MKTGYRSADRDLAEIFKPRGPEDARVPPTGYRTKDTDLAEIFAPYTGGKKAKPVGYSAGGIDLSDIFAPKED